MKKIILLLSSAMCILMLMSVNSVNGETSSLIIVPMKQKKFIITKNYKFAFANSLLNRNYVLQDVDILLDRSRMNVVKYYTLIKY